MGESQGERKSDLANPPSAPHLQESSGIQLNCDRQWLTHKHSRNRLSAEQGVLDPGEQGPNCKMKIKNWVKGQATT